MLGDVLIVSIIGLVLTGTSSGNVHYTIVAPLNFRPSSTYNVTATFYNVTDDVRLTLRLLQTVLNRTLVEKQAILKNDAPQIVSLLIPDDVPVTDYLLVAEGSGGLKIVDSRFITAQYKTLSIFVQTDKAMYKPGQAVLFRAIVLYPDLKPYQEPIDIVIYDLAGNRIMQWLDQRNESGVISQQLQLSTQTPLGDWSIIVNAGGNSFTKTFQVAEYVLPKFSVAVSLPSYFLVNGNRQDLQKDLRVSVVAKYTYGQPVKGRANVTLQLKPYSVWDTQNYTRLMKDVQLVDGKADLTISIRELLSLVPITYYSFSYTPDLWNLLSYRTILVVANVNETVTGIVLSGNATVDCTSQKYQLTFLPFSPNNYKAGLLYTAFMQLSQPDGKLPDSSDIVLPGGGGGYREVYVKITLNYPPTYDRYGTPTYYASTESYLNLTITPSGYMTLPLLIDNNNNAISVNLQPSFYVYETNSTVTGFKTINVFKSRDNQGIRITYDSPDGVIKPMKSATFNVTSTKPITTFQYQVLGKGNILLNDRVVGDLSMEHSFSIWISKDLALKLAPSARVVVWFITDSGEIITDSTELSVGDYFANQVSLWFDEESTTPSGNATLTVNAFQGSYVGLLVVDQSVLLLKAGNDVTQDMVSSELKAYSSGLNNYYPQPRFADRRRKRSIWWPTYTSGDDSYTIFSNVGLVVMTDAFFYRSSGYNNYPMAGAPGNSPRDNNGALGAPGVAGDKGPSSSPSPSGDSSEPPRVDFPDTWIWSDAVVGPDGQVAISASVPGTITSWIASAFAVSQVAGLGVATQTANLTVFKQFFLSPNLPYSVIRGEQFALQVTVFNYMPTRLDAMVTLAQSNYYKIQGSASKMAQVESNDAASVYYWVMPGALGQIPIDISVKSAVAGDAVRVMLLVKPEGVQQQYSTSVFVQLSSSTPTYDTTMLVSLPPVGTLVPGSQYIEVTTIGDLMGSSINGLDNLLQMPYGCGEQNMLTFAPDVSIVKYLSTTFQLTVDLERKAVGFMNAGYQRELTYQRSDGSFSAFGNTDLSGSVWLSAFVIKSFHQAKDYIAVEDLKIAQTMRWIIAQQTINGSFVEPPYGRVIHADMQGGSAGGLPLTAYVLIALTENQNNSQINSSSVNRSIALARSYLENNLVNAYSDPYALSIIGYALFRAQSSKYNDVLQMLERLAKVEGGRKHWEKASNDSDSSKTDWRPPYTQARSVNIEMTSYVLLTYSQLKNLSMCLPIVKWIIAQRNANGGFSSTQDTVMALEALADFATMIYGTSDERNLQIAIATDSVRHNYLPITSANSILLQSYELPANTTQVAVTASGKGSALVQLDVTYNVYKTDDVSGVELDVNTKQNGDKITVSICSSWTKKEGSGMVVIEFYLLTGYQPSNLDDLRNDPDIKLVVGDDEKVVLYLDQLTSNETCIVVILNKVFLVSNVKDAAVKVYPYYDPSGAITKFYGAPQSQNSVCTECPECCSGGVRITPTPPPKSTKSTPLPSFQKTTPQPLKKSTTNK